MEPVYQTLKIDGAKEKYLKTFTVQKKTDKSQEEISRILSVSSSVYSGTTAIDKNVVSFSGKVVYYVCYLDENGNVKKYETAQEFTESVVVEKEEDVCDVLVSVNTLKTGEEFDGGALSLSVTLEAIVETVSCREVSVFSDGENVVADKKEIEYTKSLGSRKSVYPVEDEFDLPFPVCDVLSQRLNATVTAVQCGVGCVIVDGEIYLDALLLQNEEKRDIIKEEKAIPFRMEVEYGEAMPQMLATSTVKEKSLKTDVSVDEETGKSTVNVIINLEFTAEVFENRSLLMTSDVFSTTEDLKVDVITECFSLPEKKCVTSQKIIEKTEISPLEADVSIMATTVENVSITTYSETDEGLKVEGEATFFVYAKGTAGVNVIKAKTPFDIIVDCPILDAENKKVLAVGKCATTRIVSLSELEISFDLVVSVSATKNGKFVCVKDVCSLGEKQVCDCALSVYISYPGEELWSLAKRLNESPERILMTNKDLQFPLTGDERIVVYRQKQ